MTQSNMRRNGKWVMHDDKASENYHMIINYQVVLTKHNEPMPKISDKILKRCLSQLDENGESKI